MSTAEQPGATALRTREPSAATRPRPSRPATVGRLVPWSLPVLAAVVGLSAIDVPLTAILTYGLYFVVCVVLPGVLLLRAAWRSTGNWAEDTGLGAAVGMAHQLLGWAIFTALGLQSWLVVWPLLVLAAFAAVPRLRPYWRIAAPAPLPLAWTWTVAGSAAVLVVVTVSNILADHRPPPIGTSYYQDLLFHLSIVHELTRSVPPQSPQLAGERLEYHWFANADMAGAAEITGLSPALVYFRLWLVPLAVVVLLVTAFLARQVSRVWWTGVLAALAVLPAGAVSLLSPSLTFGIVTGTVATILLIDLLFRRTGERGTWVLAAALAVAGGGSKPSTLPLLIGGVGLAALFVLVRERKWPWRAVVAGLILLVALAGTLRFVAGSTSGSGLQLLGLARFEPNYRVITGDASVPGTGDLLLPSLTSGDSTALAGVALMTARILLMSALALIGFGLLLVRSTRRDPVAWVLAGGLTAAWAGMLLINHPAASQLYFMRSAVPFAIAAATWLVAVAFRGRDRRSIVMVSVLAVALGAVFAVVTRRPALRAADPREAQVEAMARPLLVAAVLTVVLVAGWYVGRRWWGRPGLGVALPALVLIAMSLMILIRSTYYGLQTDTTFRAASGLVQPDEQAAAQWLQTHTAPTDVVVTGTWCQSAAARQPRCDARGFLVSGIAGRRTVIEGWGYAQQTLALNGLDGKRYAYQPSPWPERVDLSERILSAPTPELLDEARRQYGARWIFADRRDGPVSEKLDELAVLRFQEGDVRIYEIGGR